MKFLYFGLAVLLAAGTMGCANRYGATSDFDSVPVRSVDRVIVRDATEAELQVFEDADLKAIESAPETTNP